MEIDICRYGPLLVPYWSLEIIAYTSSYHSIRPSNISKPSSGSKSSGVSFKQLTVSSTEKSR